MATIPRVLDIRTHIISEESFNDSYNLRVELVPSWPCYPVDGSRGITHLDIEVTLIEKESGKAFVVTERENRE